MIAAMATRASALAAFLDRLVCRLGGRCCVSRSQAALDRRSAR
jgi:hypothetical protein